MDNPFIDITEFAPTFLYIIDKDQNRTKLRLNQTQLAYHNNRSNRDLVLKPRQKGISTYVQADFFRMAITQTVNTATLAHDDDTTQRFRRMVDRYYDGLVELICNQHGVQWEKLSKAERDNLPIPKKYFNNATVSTYPEFSSECYIATAGSLQKGRGGTYSHVHASEIAFWKDPQKIVSGLMQGGNPQLILESTPNGAQGYFYELCMEVLDQIPQWQDKLKTQTWLQGLDWRLHFFTWWFDNEYSLSLEPGETLEYKTDEKYGLKSELELVQKYGLTPQQIKWRRRKIREVKHEFAQEYPEDIIDCFLLSGMGYFGDIRDCLMSENEIPLLSSEHRYYGGLDFGQSNDFTVLSIIDKDTKQQVDFLRINQLSWGEMREQIRIKCNKWGVKMLLAEKNSIGSVNIEELKKEFSQHKCKTRIMEFVTTNLSKAEIMSDLHEGLHEYGLKLLPDAIQKKELQAFTRKYTTAGTPILEAPDSEHDDTVIALALAWHCAIKMGRTLIH